MMQNDQPTDAMSAEPILSAVEDYRGTMVDLDRDLTVTPAMFAAGRRELARRMIDAGLRPGDRVILAVGNGPQFIAAWAAIIAGGGSPLLVHAETPTAELKRVAERFHARFVATDNPQEAELQGTAASLQTLCGDSWTRLNWADFRGMTEPSDGVYLALPGVPLHPTSGTTAEPRMAIRPAACAVAEVIHYRKTIGLEAGQRILGMAPMCHAYGYGWFVVAPMVLGADLLTMRRFNPKMVFQAYGEREITLVPAVAAMLATLMFGAGDRLFAPLRRIITGGAPLSERIAANFERLAGSRVRPLYGTTEAGGIAVARADDPLSNHGRIGRAFDGVEIDIRPLADAPELNGECGLVHVRSASVMAGYLKNETLDAACLPDGWFNTGDLGFIDADGALHLSGRHAEVINVSGMKVLPSEVEEVIASLQGVTEVKVYAGRTRHGSNHAKAAVVVENGLSVGQIKEYCEKHLVYYKRPSRIILLDALPRSSRGKILVDQLP